MGGTLVNYVAYLLYMLCGVVIEACRVAEE
jgi:hypothetical protein